MKTGRFHHSVSIEVEFTGLDLVILEYHAKQHYDGTCNRFFECADYPGQKENDGYVWLSRWQYHDWRERFGHIEGKKIEDGEMRHPSENLELTVTEVVKPRTLDLCMKIIERLGADDTWEMVSKVFGKEMPPIEQKMSVLVLPLRMKIKEAFFQIQDEWKRLDDAAKPAPELEGELECPSCKGTNLVWQEYVCHTRPIAMHAETPKLACIDSNAEVVEFEDCKDDTLYCKDCLAPFPVPAGLDLTHV